MMRRSLEDLLGAPVDPKNDEFWTEFKRALLVAKPGPLDRRAVMNLKLVFSEVGDDQDRLASVSHFLKIFSKALRKDELKGEIGHIICRILANDELKNTSEAVDFLKAVGMICMQNLVMRNKLFEETVEEFTKSLKRGLKADPQFLTALFELEITMISQCPENWHVIERYIGKDHLKKCYRLIVKTNDSLAQMLMSEWMWRVKNRLSMTPVMDEVLKDLSPMFNEITLSKGNFRESLHAFIRTVNQESKTDDASKVIHAPFSLLLMNDKNLKCTGWIDINQDTVVIWLFEKVENLPDVVVFRLKYISEPKCDAKKLRFSTKEKLSAFDKITSERPLRLQFEISGSKKFTYEFMTRCNRPRQATPQAVVPPKNRVYAKKPGASVTPKPAMKGVSIYDEATGHIGLPSTEQRDLSVEQIDRQVTEFYEKSRSAMEELRTRIQNELQAIITKAGEQKKLLAQFAQQHRQMAEATTAENAKIAATVQGLEQEFELRHDDTVKRRSAIMNSTMEDIHSLKQQFIDETNAAFENNAIIGLSQNLSNLQAALSAGC